MKGAQRKLLDLQAEPLLTDAAKNSTERGAMPIKPELTDLSSLMEDRVASPFGSEVASYSQTSCKLSDVCKPSLEVVIIQPPLEGCSNSAFHPTNRGVPHNHK